MRQTCSEITSGMSVVALSAFAKEHGLNLPRQESGVIFMVESKTLGRWGCRVTLEKGWCKVQSTTLQIKVVNSRFRWILQCAALTLTLWLIDKYMTSIIFEKLDSFLLRMITYSSMPFN
jgi:hypothetical protein